MLLMVPASFSRFGFEESYRLINRIIFLLICAFQPLDVAACFHFLYHSCKFVLWILFECLNIKFVDYFNYAMFLSCKLFLDNCLALVTDKEILENFIGSKNKGCVL